MPSANSNWIPWDIELLASLIHIGRNKKQFGAMYDATSSRSGIRDNAVNQHDLCPLGYVRREPGQKGVGDAKESDYLCKVQHRVTVKDLWQIEVDRRESHNLIRWVGWKIKEVNVTDEAEAAVQKSALFRANEFVGCEVLFHGTFTTFSTTLQVTDAWLGRRKLNK